MEYLKTLEKSGFNFTNTLRNDKHLGVTPKDKVSFVKTGTTIVGVLCKDGVVLAADTRATMHFVAEKNTRKIHYIAPNIRVCGAGTAADLQYVGRKFFYFWSLGDVKRLGWGCYCGLGVGAGRYRWGYSKVWCGGYIVWGWGLEGDALGALEMGFAESELCPVFTF